MTKRQFHKYVYTVEVLSEDPIDGDASLKEISYLITDGPCSGRVDCRDHKTLDGRQAVRTLKRQGSDPAWFQLDPHGEDIEL